MKKALFLLATITIFTACTQTEVAADATLTDSTTVCVDTLAIDTLAVAEVTVFTDSVK